MLVAAFQMVAAPGDVPANLAALEDAAARAQRRGAEFLIAPELATTGYGAGEAIRDLAHDLRHDTVTRLSAAARQHGITIVAGFAERAGGTVFNSALLVGPDGGPVVYRKCHLYGRYERDLFAPGDRCSALVTIAGLKVGILICYDVEFPEAVRSLALAGADIIAVPTALPETPHAEFIASQVVPVRAFENQVAVIYANHAGRDELFQYAGRSCIAMPDGTVAARAGTDAAELIVAEFEPDRYAASRAANPYLTDRRTDLG